MAVNQNESALTDLESQGKTKSAALALLEQLGLAPDDLPKGTGPASVGDFVKAVQAQAKTGGSKPESASDWLHAVASLPGALQTQLQSLGAEGLSKLGIGPGTSQATPAKKAAPKLPAPAKAAAPEVTQSPYEQLANALADSYLQQTNQLEGLVSGQGIFGQGGQTQQLLAAATKGMDPQTAAWINQQAGAEGQAAAPLHAAMAQQGNAVAAGALGMGNAIGQEGVANTEYLAAAPYQQILQELANETAYKAASNTGAAAFGGNAQTTPAFLQQIFKNLGLGSVPGAAGTPTLPGAPKAATGGTTGTTPATSGSSNPSAP